MLETMLAEDTIELTDVDRLGISTMFCPVWPTTVGMTGVAVLDTVPV
jgi:hypothetical protein